MCPLFWFVLPYLMIGQYRQYVTIAFYDQQKKPVSDLYVYFQEIETGRTLSYWLTKKNHLHCCLRCGYHYRILAQKEGYCTINLLHDTKGKACHCCYKLCLIPCHINGTIYGTIYYKKANENIPLKGATVVLYQYKNTKQLAPIRFTKTNKLGLYQFLFVPQGSYVIKAIR